MATTASISRKGIQASIVDHRWWGWWRGWSQWWRWWSWWWSWWYRGWWQWCWWWFDTQSARTRRTGSQTIMVCSRQEGSSTFIKGIIFTPTNNIQPSSPSTASKRLHLCRHPHRTAAAKDGALHRQLTTMGGRLWQLWKEAGFNPTLRGRIFGLGWILGPGKGWFLFLEEDNLTSVLLDLDKRFTS